MDLEAINETNIILEHLKDADVLVAVTVVEEELVIKKSMGKFFVDDVKFTRPPQLNSFGNLIYYPPSLRNNLYIQSKQIKTLKLNDKVIYNLK